jgi:U5 small nuclear ribonucleoprotein component
LTIIAEPLEKEIISDIESGSLKINVSPKELQKTFQEKYGWDLLASKGIWAFGPENYGPNMLIDDTLASEVCNVISIKNFKPCLIGGQKTFIHCQRFRQTGIPVGCPRRTALRRK